MPGRCAAPPAPAMMTLNPSALAPLANVKQSFRCAVRGDDPAFTGDAERGQRFRGMAHGLPIRLASHDDGDNGGHLSICLFGNPEIDPNYRKASVRGKQPGMNYPFLVNGGKPCDDEKDT